MATFAFSIDILSLELIEPLLEGSIWFRFEGHY